MDACDRPENRGADAAALERLQDLVELACSTAPLGVFERDFCSGADSWSREMFGMRALPERAQPPSFEEAAGAVIAADRPHFDAAMRGSLLPRHDRLRRQHFRLRYRLHAADGSLRYLHKQWVVRYGADGRAEFLRGVVIDETAYESLLRWREAAVAALEMTSALTGLAVWRQDVSTGLVRLNARASALFGVDPGSGPIPVLRLRRGLHPDDREVADAADVAALSEGRPVDAVLRQRGRSGEWRHLMTRRGVQADVDGTALALMGVVLDMADPAGRDGDADDGLAFDPQAPPREGVPVHRFLALLGHELRMPNNEVRGFAQLLMHGHGAAGVLQPGAGRGAFAYLRDAGRQLTALIDDVLDLSRLEGGELTLTLQPVPLAPLLAAVLKALDSALRERRMRVTTAGLVAVGPWGDGREEANDSDNRNDHQGGDDAGGFADGHVLGDAPRLRQVLLELLGQTLRQGDVGGRLALSAGRHADGIRLRLTLPGPAARKQAPRDAGDPAQPAGAADLDPAEALRRGGVGLALARALMERMGGRIDACGLPDEGSGFELTLLTARAVEPSLR